VSEIYGSGGYDSPSRDNDAAYERSTGSGSWENYNPEAELERLGITRAGEWAKAKADWDSQQSPDADGQADDGSDGGGRGNSHEPAAEAWDQDPDIDDDYYRDDAAIEAGLDEADLPTRAGSRADTWEDSPDSAYAADLEPEGEDGDTHAADSARGRDGDGTLIPQATDLTTRGDHPYPDSQRAPSSDRDAGPDETDPNAETDDGLHQRVADLEAANAELRNENTQLAKDIVEVESENAELGKTVTELRTENADLRRGFSAHEARLERLEQTRLDVPATSIRDRDQGVQGGADQQTKLERDRKVPSSEALLFGATVIGGVVTTVADYVQYVPASIAGITAGVFAAGATAVAWMRKRRED
jgi:hypothetical protein